MTEAMPISENVMTEAMSLVKFSSLVIYDDYKQRKPRLVFPLLAMTQKESCYRSESQF